MAVLLGTVSGQPELVAVGGVGKALASSATTLMGGQKKRANFVIPLPTGIEDHRRSPGERMDNAAATGCAREGVFPEVAWHLCERRYNTRIRYVDQ